MSLSSILGIISVVILVIGGIFAFFQFINKRKEEAVSSLLLTVGVELICGAFGTFDDKVFAYLSNQQVDTNIVQLVTGLILLAGGVYFSVYIRNKIYILNINGYFDKRIEQHQGDLNLSPFEFKEKEIDFIRIFKKGMNPSTAHDIQDELQTKVAVFKTESKERRRGYTGIAPIPFIIRAGKLFEREKIDEFYEYDKLNDQYYSLINQGKFRQSPYPQLLTQTPIDSISNQNPEEIVVAISCTSQITPHDTAQFPFPVIHLSVDAPKDNLIQYKDQLKEYTTSIYDLLVQIKNGLPSVKVIHFVMASQSCLAFEVGKLIDDHRIPKMISYQYANQGTPRYPWGLIINGAEQGTYVSSNQ